MWEFGQFGSPPHQILSVQSRALQFISGGKEVCARYVMHPGTAARPFMASTLTEQKSWIRAQLDEALRKGVAEEYPEAFETTPLKTAGDHLKQRIGAEARLALPRTTEPE
jgi:hypothetical protein